MKKGKIKSNQTNIFVSGHLRRQLARGLWFSTLPQVKMLQQCNLETSSNFHTFLFQVDQMAPGLAWQKIPMILSLYLPILKQKSTWAHPAGRVPGLHSGSPAAAMLVWESWGQQLQGLSQPRQEPLARTPSVGRSPFLASTCLQPFLSFTNWPPIMSWTALLPDFLATGGLSSDEPEPSWVNPRACLMEEPEAETAQVLFILLEQTARQQENQDLSCTLSDCLGGPATGMQGRIPACSHAASKKGKKPSPHCFIKVTFHFQDSLRLILLIKHKSIQFQVIGILI